MRIRHLAFSLLPLLAAPWWGPVQRELPAETGEPLSALALRDALERWRNGKPPAVGIDACYRAMRLVDDAYALARERGTSSVQVNGAREAQR